MRYIKEGNPETGSEGLEEGRRESDCFTGTQFLCRTSQVMQWYSIHPPSRRPRFDPWVGKMPLEKEMVIHSSILAWESHGQRSLAGYSLWVTKRQTRLID